MSVIRGFPDDIRDRRLKRARDGLESYKKIVLDLASKETSRDRDFMIIKIPLYMFRDSAQDMRDSYLVSEIDLVLDELNNHIKNLPKHRRIPYIKTGDVW